MHDDFRPDSDINGLVTFSDDAYKYGIREFVSVKHIILTQEMIK